MITHIIWDYNGTVVDDVKTSVAAVNAMLRARSLPPTDLDTYKETLTMPLDKYYESVGIINPDISVLSIEFQKYCDKYSHMSKIFDGFDEVINLTKKLSITNILLSSLYEGFLVKEAEKYSITECFDKIIGLKDTSVSSKLNNAKKYLTDMGLSTESVLFVGDLTTDYNMAKALGCKCVLIPNGHNSKRRCMLEEVQVCEDLFDFAKYIQSI